MTGQLASFIVSPRTTVLSLTKPASAGTSPRQIPYWGTWQKKHYVDSSWNVMEHVDAREGKWRWNWRMKWVASTLHTTSEHGVSSITTANAHTSAASSRLNWRPPADLNGLVRFAERRNRVSARVPSHFNWPPQTLKSRQQLYTEKLHNTYVYLLHAAESFLRSKPVFT